MREQNKKVKETADGIIPFSLHMAWEPTPYPSNGLFMTCLTLAASLNVAILKELAQRNSGRFYCCCVKEAFFSYSWTLGNSSIGRQVDKFYTCRAKAECPIGHYTCPLYISTNSLESSQWPTTGQQWLWSL